MYGSSAAGGEVSGRRSAKSLELKELDEFLLARAMEHDSPSLLFRLGCEYVRSAKVIRPGVVTLLEKVGTARKAAARRARHHQVDAVHIGFAVLDGRKTEVSPACPVCGKRFIPGHGHGHRRDTKFDLPSCRTAAWRQRVRQAVNKATPTKGTASPTSKNTDGSVERVREIDAIDV
ncbi:DUF4158 domain-containing protein [Streptomyces benahoarensis]|uniref:DUF4158 domain-containing protein n=1 Tax=Streptomyces benahoarensis TaxID=2595054 RepID=UPI00163D67F5|nr:DUF4158 domain-containing protein [Streptomyces benahoarensis]